MPYYYLMRHGECQDNINGFIPREDSPVTYRGMDDIDVAAKFLDGLPIKELYSGTSARAQETAQRIQNYLHIPFYEVNPIFNERRVTAPQEESLEKLSDRARSLLSRLEGRDTSVIVSHAAIMKMIIAVCNNYLNPIEYFSELDTNYVVRSAGVARLKFNGRWHQEFSGPDPFLKRE